jgi:hypothetical protein
VKPLAWLRSFAGLLSTDARLFSAVVAFGCFVGVAFVLLDLMLGRSLCLYGVVKFC